MSTEVKVGLPVLTDAEFRVTRESLGLTLDATAERLGVHLRTVSRWEAGDAPIPPGVADTLREWVDQQDAQADAWAARLVDVPEPVLVIPRAGVREGWPAGWWRALAARVVEDVPGLRVTYGDR